MNANDLVCLEEFLITESLLPTIDGIADALIAACKIIFKTVEKNFSEAGGYMTDCFELITKLTSSLWSSVANSASINDAFFLFAILILTLTISIVAGVKSWYKSDSGKKMIIASGKFFASIGGWLVKTAIKTKEEVNNILYAVLKMLKKPFGDIFSKLKNDENEQLTGKERKKFWNYFVVGVDDGIKGMSTLWATLRDKFVPARDKNTFVVEGISFSFIVKRVLVSVAIAIVVGLLFYLYKQWTNSNTEQEAIKAENEQLRGRLEFNDVIQQLQDAREKNYEN